MYLNWRKYNINIPQGKGRGNTKVLCPQCHAQRTDKRDLQANLIVTTADGKAVLPKRKNGKRECGLTPIR